MNENAKGRWDYPVTFNLNYQPGPDPRREYLDNLLRVLKLIDDQMPTGRPRAEFLVLATKVLLEEEVRVLGT